MKKIGLVGGVAWRSTVEYYAGICRRSEEQHASKGEQENPSIEVTPWGLSPSGDSGKGVQCEGPLVLC